MSTYVGTVSEGTANPSSGLAGAEGVAGAAAIVLTILGLAHVAPPFLVAVATIAVGIALAAHGADTAGRYARLVIGRPEMGAAAAGGGPWSMEFLAGAGGVILGVLALLQVNPDVLVAIAAIGFGAGITVSSSVSAQLAVMGTSGSDANDPLRRIVAESASSSAAVQVLAGLSAIVLGILSLSGFASVTLVLVALLAVGSFAVVNGSIFGSMMMSMFRH